MFILLILILFCADLCDSENFATSWDDDGFRLTTKRLPDDLKWMPVLSNGHVGFTVFGSVVYMNGLFNGAGGLSHRAAIPNWSGIQIVECVREPSQCSYTLNLRTGVFETVLETNDFRLTHLIYPHRYYNRAIVNQFYIKRLNSASIDDIKIKLQKNPGNQETRTKTNENKRNKFHFNDSNDKSNNNSYKNNKNTNQNNKKSQGFFGVVDELWTDSDRMWTDIIFDKKRTIVIASSKVNVTVNVQCGHTSELEDEYHQVNQKRNNNNLNKTVRGGIEANKVQEEEEEVKFQQPEEQQQQQQQHKRIQFSKEFSKKQKRNHYNICVLWNYVPEEITLKHNEYSISYKFVMTLDKKYHLGKQEMMNVFSINDNELLKSHSIEWKEFWNNFHIELVGNEELKKKIYSSVYYLVSSLPSLNSQIPNDEFYGLSPTGLGFGGGDNVNDYEGHVFWDTEVWKLPPITLINPEWSKQLLSYRFNKLSKAMDYANATGYEGARFPWESAFTGKEVIQPCCPLIAKYQQHITADISLAMRLYFGVTYDLDWFIKEGCELSREIAKFWASRVSYDSSNGLYEINGVMGPDEDHSNINNNAFTNVAAAYALEFGEFTECLCNNNLNFTKRNWTDIANRMKILFDQNLDYHPEYEGYKIGTPVKQADTILLGYPLQYPMETSSRLNDLRIYENVTRQSGPAMTWSMYAINYLDLNQTQKANEMFNKSYQPYIRKPFNVWSEVIEGEDGAHNFITGAGGFLQVIFNGFAGIRIHLDHMEIKNPILPENTKYFKINGIFYMGSRFSIEIIPGASIIEFSTITIPLEIQIEGKIFVALENRKYKFTQRQSILVYRQQKNHGCN